MVKGQKQGEGRRGRMKWQGKGEVAWEDRWGRERVKGQKQGAREVRS